MTLLRTFGKIELNRLRKFVASPYLNDEPDVLRLFDYCHLVLKKNPADLNAASVPAWIWSTKSAR